MKHAECFRCKLLLLLLLLLFLLLLLLLLLLLSSSSMGSWLFIVCCFMVNAYFSVTLMSWVILVWNKHLFPLQLVHRTAVYVLSEWGGSKRLFSPSVMPGAGSVKTTNNKSQTNKANKQTNTQTSKQASKHANKQTLQQQRVKLLHTLKLARPLGGAGSTWLGEATPCLLLLLIIVIIVVIAIVVYYCCYIRWNHAMPKHTTVDAKI